MSPEENMGVLYQSCPASQKMVRKAAVVKVKEEVQGTRSLGSGDRANGAVTGE